MEDISLFLVEVKYFIRCFMFMRKQMEGMLKQKRKQMEEMENKEQGMREQMEGMRKQMEDKERELRCMREQMEGMRKQIEDKEQEQEVYSALYLTRSLAVVSLMATLLKLLDNFFMQRASENQKDVTRMKLVFPEETEISYFRAWWFLYDETLAVKGLSLQQFWAQSSQLGYSDKRQSIDPRKEQKNDKFGTWQASVYAQKLSHIMKCAEQDCINAVGCGMSADDLRKVVGFYISVLRIDRNAGTHLLENLLVVDVLEGKQQPKDQKSKAKKPFKFINKDLALNRDVETQKKGAMVIKDILSNIDKLGSLSCISPTVKWFGGWLLSQIDRDKGTW